MHRGFKPCMVAGGYLPVLPVFRRRSKQSRMTWRAQSWTPLVSLARVGTLAHLLTDFDAHAELGFAAAFGIAPLMASEAIHSPPKTTIPRQFG